MDSASFLSVASSMFASREMDLWEVGKAADEVHHLNFAFTKKKKHPTADCLKHEAPPTVTSTLLSVSCRGRQSEQ